MLQHPSGGNARFGQGWYSSGCGGMHGYRITVLVCPVGKVPRDPRGDEEIRRQEATRVVEALA
jgi:hypothetical protein